MIEYIFLKKNSTKKLKSLTSDIDSNKWSINYPLLAKEMIKKYHMIFLDAGEVESNQIFAYSSKKGVYIQLTDSSFGSIVCDMVPEVMFNTSVKSNAFAAVKSHIRKKVKMNENEGIINFKNGMLILETMELVPHDAKYLSSVQINCDWNPKAKPRTHSFDKFMDTFCNKETNPESFENTKEMLMRFFGMAISNVKGYRLKKGLFVVGQGNTGKTLLKTLCERIIGSEYVINLDLQALESRWGTGNCFNKRVVGSNDQSFSNLKDLTKFKQLTGGDNLFAEHKGKDGFTFVFNGVIWICGNQMPRFSGDKGKHLYERLMIYEPLTVIPPNQRDKHLIDKMLQEKEYVVRLVVEALVRMIKEDYSVPESSVMIEKRNQHEIENDTLLSFIDECCVKGDQVKDYKLVSTRMFYDIYKSWCNDNYGYIYGKQELRKTLVNMDLGETKKTNKGRYYMNITITDEGLDEYGNNKVAYDFYETKKDQGEILY